MSTQKLREATKAPIRSQKERAKSLQASRWSPSRTEVTKVTMMTIALVLVLCFLAGCSNLQTQVVKETQLVLVEPDPLYLKDCAFEEPPALSGWLTLSSAEREDLLTRSAMKQYEYTRACSLDKVKLRAWLKSAKERIDAQNANTSNP